MLCKIATCWTQVHAALGRLTQLSLQTITTLRQPTPCRNITRGAALVRVLHWQEEHPGD